MRAAYQTAEGSMRYAWMMAAVLAFGAHAQAQSVKQGCTPAKVHFALDSSRIPETDYPDLDRAAACLKDNQRLRVEIAGNADERGTEEYNLALGDMRARSVSSYLQQQGVSDEQL